MKIAPVWNLPPANLIECLRLRSAAQVESRADVVRDEVEISERAQWMSKMQELPQARQERVAQIKAALAGDHSMYIRSWPCSSESAVSTVAGAQRAVNTFRSRKPRTSQTRRASS